MLWEPHLDLCICSPNLWPLPTVGCSLQLDGQLCTHQLAMSSVASTPSCGTTIMVSYHTAGKETLGRSVVHKAGRRHISTDFQPNNYLFGLQELDMCSQCRLCHSRAALTSSSLLFLETATIPPLAALHPLTAEHVA